MPPRDRWTRVDELFQRALELPPGRRAAWLVEASAGDESVRADVESLLAHHDRSGAFLESPAVLEHARDTVEATAADPPLPADIGPYRVLGLVGAGGMGIVMRAEDTRLGRVVALKMLQARAGRDDEARLQREARAAALLGHPNIATVYALEEFDGQFYMASELVEGRTLRQLVDEGPIGTRTAIDMARAVARALELAHQRGLAHGDLKPENVMLAHDGRVKVLDFGLARFVGASAAAPTGAPDAPWFGTPGYLAPEQLGAGPVDGRIDLFALGVMLHELVTGDRPAQATGGPSWLRIRTGTPELDAIVRRCTEKDPDRRYPSAGVLLADLERLAGQLAERLSGRSGRASSDGGASNGSTPHGRTSSRPTFWWQFHQGVIGVVYTALALPLWFAWRWTGTTAGQTLFFAGLVAIISAVTLRWHLWFTWRETPTEWEEQRLRVSPWIRGLDFAVAALVALAGAPLLPSYGELSALLLASAIGLLISALVIEPATTRAAFGGRSDREAP